MRNGGTEIDGDARVGRNAGIRKIEFPAFNEVWRIER